MYKLSKRAGFGAKALTDKYCRPRKNPDPWENLQKVEPPPPPPPHSTLDYYNGPVFGALIGDLLFGILPRGLGKTVPRH